MDQTIGVGASGTQGSSGQGPLCLEQQGLDTIQAFFFSFFFCLLIKLSLLLSNCALWRVIQVDVGVRKRWEGGCVVFERVLNGRE